MSYIANVYVIVSDDNLCGDRRPKGGCCAFATPIIPENCNRCVIMLGMRTINSPHDILFTLDQSIFDRDKDFLGFEMILRAQAVSD